jgi:hypothetical protein
MSSDDDCDRGVGAEMSELAGATCGHERDGESARRRMRHDSGVDHGGVRCVVSSKGDDNTQAVVECHKFCELHEVCHVVGSLSSLLTR